jgi:hypothetical protein
MLPAGCATSDRADRAALPLETVGAEIRTCPRDPVPVPEGALDAGTTEKLWKQDRGALVDVNGCLRSAIAHSDDVAAAGKAKR